MQRSWTSIGWPPLARSHVSHVCPSRIVGLPEAAPGVACVPPSRCRVCKRPYQRRHLMGARTGAPTGGLGRIGRSGRAYVGRANECPLARLDRNGRRRPVPYASTTGSPNRRNARPCGSPSSPLARFRPNRPSFGCRISALADKKLDRPPGWTVPGCLRADRLGAQSALPKGAFGPGSCRFRPAPRPGRRPSRGLPWDRRTNLLPLSARPRLRP